MSHLSGGIVPLWCEIHPKAFWESGLTLNQHPAFTQTPLSCHDSLTFCQYLPHSSPLHTQKHTPTQVFPGEAANVTGKEVARFFFRHISCEEDFYWKLKQADNGVRVCLCESLGRYGHASQIVLVVALELLAENEFTPRRHLHHKHTLQKHE